MARRADALGYATLWTYGRLLVPTDAMPGLGPAHASVLDPVVALAYAAAHTRRIRLGTATVSALFVAPVVLAKTLASLDLLCGGRVSVGLGMGWLEPEYVAAGIPFRDRGARLEEYLRCLVALWTEDPVSFAGHFYTVPSARLAPRPLQRPHPPILLGGTAPAALDRAGRLAQGWIAASSHDLSRLADDIETVRDGARAAGRDPGALEFLVRGVVDLQDPTQPRPPGSSGRRPLQGTPAEIRDDLAALAADGVTEVLIDLNLSPRISGAGARVETALDYAEAVLTAFAPEPDPGVRPEPRSPRPWA